MKTGVMDAVQQSLHSAVGRISIMTGVVLTQVWKILHADGFYHLQRVHQLLLEDHAPHVQCCDLLQ
jgi:hypothetical protein